MPRDHLWLEEFVATQFMKSWLIKSRFKEVYSKVINLSFSLGTGEETGQVFISWGEGRNASLSRQ